MKFLIILILLSLIIFLSIKIIHKKIQEQEKHESDMKFNSNGDEIISKDSYIALLRKNVVDLYNIVDEIVEKDSDDIISKNNLLKALKVLDVESNEGVSDDYVLEIQDLISNVEKHYNL